ncbi:PD-(D/E)XK nuclease family protein [Candidatus Saccharibacteria bacterium]|nr:PD-(D/E)XK nuclease family protein [Candidatus Saccharibacteria bacterium]
MSYMRERSKPYEPGQRAPYKVSRSKIELYMQCPRCFWLDVRRKITRPSGPPFNINKAIDELFKKEFDLYRQQSKKHPLMEKFGVDAVPFQHKDLDTWRHNFTGVSTVHEPTNLHVFGAVDDVWVDSNGALMVVDYKATAKAQPVKSLGAEGTWYDMYRRQMEIYQWLLRQNGFDVSDTGYFVYATGDPGKDAFDGVVEFETHVFPHTGSSDWVEQTLLDMKACMDSDTMPDVGRQVMDASKDCEYCTYARARTELTVEALQKRQK